MRQISRALHRIPQLLLVQPEQLAYDLAYALALAPLVIAGVIFFRQQAALTFALSLLAGIVCLLALQLARLTFGLPAWVGHKATHPLVASLLIACFLSPLAPAWLAASLVIVFVVMDTVLWPQLQRVMLHPALIVFGILFIAQRQLNIGFINPFDMRHLPDQLTFWYRHQLPSIDPIKLYVGNVPGPIGVTSAGAVVLGFVYLWYTRKVSLGIFLGFLFGVAALAVALGQDVAFQLASGPALFVAGYIAADRRRVLLPERFTFVFGTAAGAATMVLRWYGQGQEAAWMSLLFASVLVTLFLRIRWIIGRSSLSRPGRPSFRTLTLESGDPEPKLGFSPVRQEVRQPAMAMSGAGSALKVASGSQPLRAYNADSNPDDLVRQMRRAATGGAWSLADSPVVWILSLVIVNPIGLWLTWNRPWFDAATKRLITAVSVLWYLAVAGLVLALTHLR